MEQSVVSKTTSSSKANKDLAIGQSHRMDKLFPYYDYICKFVHIPNSLTSLMDFIMLLQIQCISLWPMSEYCRNLGENNGVMKYVKTILTCDPFDPRDIPGGFWVEAIVSVVSIALFGFCLAYYYKNRRFITWIMYVTQFINSVVAKLMIIPSGVILGFFLSKIIDTHSPISIICFIFQVFFASWLLFLYCPMVIMINRSPNARFSSTSLFNPMTQILLPLITLPIPFVQSLFLSFPNYGIVLFVIIHIALVCYFLYVLLGYVYHDLWTNVSTFSFSAGLIAGDIFSFACIMIPTIPSFVPLVAQYVVVIISFIVYGTILNKQKNKIVEILTYKTDIREDDDYYNQLYESLGIDTSERKALIYLRIGFREMCDYFLDFSLLQYVINNHPSTPIVAQCVQLISYFPGELRKMNALFTNLIQRRDLSMADRFLVFSLYRLKTLRSSSVSNESTERLLQLRQISRQFEGDLKLFWNAPKATMGFTEMISERGKRIEMLWEEAVRDFPNNVKILDEYVRFHCECTTKFDKAVSLKSRAEKIEGGANMASDYPFRALVKSMPQYLKKNKVDFNGNILVNRRVNHGGGSSSSSSKSGHSSSNNFISQGNDSSVDIEAENVIGKSILTQSKVRLSLHRAVMNRKSQYEALASWTTVICIIITLVIAGVYITYSYKDIQENATTTKYIKYVSSIRYYTALIQSQHIVRYAFENGHVDKDMAYKIFDNSYAEDEKIKDNEGYNNESYFDARNDMVKMIKTNLQNLEHELTDFLQAISIMQKNGVPVYQTMAVVLTNKANLTQCLNGKPVSGVSQPLMNSVMTEIFTQFEQTINEYQGDVFMKSNEFCEGTLNAVSIATNLEAVGIQLCAYQDGKNAEKLAVYNILRTVLPVVIVFINLIPICIASALFYVDIQKALHTLTSMPHAMKEANKKPISREAIDDGIFQAEPKMPISKVFGYGIYVFIMSVSFTIIIWVFGNQSYIATNNIRHINQWMLYAGKRYGYASESVHEVLLTLLRSHSNGVVSPGFRNKAMITLGFLEEANKNLTDGSAFTVKCYGTYSKLDSLNFNEVCELDKDDSGNHDNYRCSSLSSSVSSLRSIGTELLAYTDTMAGSLNNELAFHFLHHAGSHSLKRFGDFVDILAGYTDSEVETEKWYYYIVIAACIVFTIIQFGFLVVYNSFLNSAYQGLMTLIKHVTPSNIMLSKDLLNFLLNRSPLRKDGKMEVAQMVIHESPDSILCTALNGIVEVINESVTLTFGYTPEQLLGQPIFSIINPSESEAIQKQVQMMASDQASPIFETGVTILSDTMAEIGCAATILGMTKKGSSTIESFVFIMRNETELREQRHRAEKAKAQSEKLLYQILPRDIVSMLNAGEKDISFTVPSATVIFIDINRFSEYCQMLQPEGIMMSLSTIFAQFDEIIKKFPLLTKIKLIGDIYMAAGGLFCKEADQAAAHAEQGVMFAIQCLNALESINVTLNASLQVRIGINTGGPLIAGVLGTDKPTFDIIGDPINVAARLQSTDTPGRIQISKATAELLDQNLYYIEQRGEVYLKGKGMQMTYYVSNTTSFMSSFSTLEMISATSQ